MNASEPREWILKAGEAETATGGRWLGQPRAVRLRGAVSYNRAVTPGCVFACFSGQRHDGHDFAASAAAAGAALLIASRVVSVPVPVLMVDDVTMAIGGLARLFRRRFRGATWIGVTGSSGKTTVKELLAAACGAVGFVHATAGNLNNRIGLPLTILSTPAATRFAVIEMGTSVPGEIPALAAIAQPDQGVLTAIGPAHLTGFGSLAGVAKEKLQLFTAVPWGAPVLFGRHGLVEACAATGCDPEAIMGLVRAAASGRELTVVGSGETPVDGDCEQDAVVLRTAQGTARIPLVGRHNLANAALAFHAACRAGVDPAQALAGLASVRAVPGRLRILPLDAHRIIDDAYNANPGSMSAGLAVLAGLPGRRLAVLGGMGELGTASQDLHARVGAEAARLGVALIAVGARAEPIAAGYLAAGGCELGRALGVSEALVSVREYLSRGPAAVLVKASHSEGLDCLVRDLVAVGERAGASC